MRERGERERKGVGSERESKGENREGIHSIIKHEHHTWTKCNTLTRYTLLCIIPHL